MGNKKKKYNARFPPARIKKIMQTDEDVGKVAAAVPVIISRALELFVESLIVKTCETTQAKSAKTLTPAHIKHAIKSEKTFDFLKDLVANVPDQSTEDDIDNVTFPHPNAANRVTATENRRPRAPRGRRKLQGASPGQGHRKVRKTSSDTSQIDDEEDDDENDDTDDYYDDSVSETSCDPSPQTQPCRPSVIVSSPPCSSNGSLPINYSMHSMMAPPAALDTAASLLPPSGVPMTMPCSNLMSLSSFNNPSEDDDYDA